MLFSTKPHILFFPATLVRWQVQLLHGCCTSQVRIGTTAGGAACFDAVLCTLQAEMAGSPGTAAILDALNSQRADARERQAAMERQIREEARRLRGGVAGQRCSC